MLLAIEALVLLFFVIPCTVIAFRIVRSVSLLREFGTPVTVSLLLTLTLLLYVVPVLSVPASARFPAAFFNPFPLAALFFVPHLLMSRIAIRNLQAAGTSRVRAIRRSIEDSVWLGHGGIAYVGIVWLLSFAAHSLASRVP